MKYKIDKSKLVEYIKLEEKMSRKQMKKWDLQSESYESSQLDKIEREIRKLENQRTKLIAKRQEKLGVDKIDYSEDEHNHLRRVIGRIKKKIYDEAYQWQRHFKIFLSEWSGARFRFNKWYYEQTLEGVELTKSQIKAKLKEFDEVN